jgi:lysophospholipase
MLFSPTLYATPDNPIPPGAIEETVAAADGVKLRAARWTPASARGTVVLLGGRTEYIEKYFETIADMLGRGFAVATMDWRGQGGSERPLPNPMKGHIDDFALYERDFAAFQRDALAACPRPWIGLCHSMGGAIMLRIAHEGRCPFERLIVTAPMIALSRGAVPDILQPLATPRFLRGLAEIVDGLGLGGAFAPGGGSAPLGTSPFEGNPLTSDPDRYRRLQGILRAHPQIGLGGPTVGWVHAAMRLMREFADADYPRAIATPTLVVASGADRVVDLRSIERFASRLRAGALIVIDGARHEVMVERDLYRAQFFAAFDAYAGGATREAFTPPYRAAV